LGSQSAARSRKPEADRNHSEQIRDSRVAQLGNIFRTTGTVPDAKDNSEHSWQSVTLTVPARPWS